MGALFGLEGGFVTNRYRKRRPRQVRFPPDSNRIAGASTPSEKCQQRTPFATPSCRLLARAANRIRSDRNSSRRSRSNEGYSLHIDSSHFISGLSCKTALKSELWTSIFPLKLMSPGLRNLFMKKTDAGSGRADHLC